MLGMLTGCGLKATPPSPPSDSGISPVRYTIQAGAFSSVENAIRMTRSLESHGLDAYYYREPSGFFRVRFGDFASREEATDRARSLLADGIIDAYYVVSPDAYAIARTGYPNTSRLRADIVETAERFIGVPYQWGGTSREDGFDCSGLVMAVYQLNGFKLPRASSDQYASGRPVAQYQLKGGDLVFFSFSQGKKVSHVGIYAGKGYFIHAPGRGKFIRKDALSNPSFQARFVGARTYLR
jgi:cell wall-associated NlpC family hydrolase